MTFIFPESAEKIYFWCCGQPVAGAVRQFHHHINLYFTRNLNQPFVPSFGWPLTVNNQILSLETDQVQLFPTPILPINLILVNVQVAPKLGGVPAKLGGVQGGQKGRGRRRG